MRLYDILYLACKRDPQCTDNGSTAGDAGTPVVRLLHDAHLAQLKTHLIDDTLLHDAAGFVDDREEDEIRNVLHQSKHTLNELPLRQGSRGPTMIEMHIELLFQHDKVRDIRYRLKCS